MKRGQLIARKVFTIAVACVLVMMMGVGISACKDEKQVVSEEVASEFENLKNPSLDSIQDYKNDASLVDFVNEYNLSDAEVLDLAKGMFSRVEYQIKQVNVDGNSASVDLTVSNADVEAAVNNAIQDVKDRAFTNPEIQKLIANADEEGLVKKILETFYAEVDQVDMISDRDITIKLEKNDNGSWEITDDSVDNLLNTLVP